MQAGRANGCRVSTPQKGHRLRKQLPLPMQPVKRTSRAQERQKTARSPILGTRPTWPAGQPGVFAPAGLRRFWCRLLGPRSSLRTSVMRFFRHNGIFPSDVGSLLRPSLSWSHCLPPTTPTQTRENAGRNILSLIVQMSSDRLFLDGLLASRARLRFTGATRLTRTSPAHGQNTTFLLCREYDISTLR